MFFTLPVHVLVGTTKTKPKATVNPVPVTPFPSYFHFLSRFSVVFLFSIGSQFYYAKGLQLWQE